MADTGAPGFIPLASGSDQFSPPQAPINAVATALNTALGKTAFNTYATKALLDAAPGTITGQHASVNADPTTPNNGDYTWNGTVWVRIGAEYTNAFADPAGTSGSGVTLTSIAFPSRSYATFVDYDFMGQVGNASGTTFAMAPSTTGGTLSGPAYVPFTIAVSGWGAVVQAGRLTLPASTAATLTFSTNGGGGIWHAAIKTRRIPQ